MASGDFKRWLYQGQRPNRLARFLNRGWAMISSRGIAPDYLVALEVKGRKSGRTTSFPLVMVAGAVGIAVEGDAEVTLVLEGLSLVEGTYTVDVAAHRRGLGTRTGDVVPTPHARSTGARSILR